MLVYRLMHTRSRDGPWVHYGAHRDTQSWLDMGGHWNAIGANSHSSPSDDGICYDTSRRLWDKGYVCGCTNITQVYHWFGEFWESWVEYGFALFEIDIPSNLVVIADHQILLLLAKAVSERIVSIDEYREMLFSRRGQ